STADRSSEPGRLGPILRHATKFARTQPLGTFGLVVLVLLLLMALFGPMITPFDPYRSAPGAARLESPSWTHWAGTDETARDVFSRIIYGARTSVLVGLIGVSIGTIGGTIVGAVSAYFGGWVDLIIQRIVDTL